MIYRIKRLSGNIFLKYGCLPEGLHQTHHKGATQVRQVVSNTIVMSVYGAMGPSMVAFLKEVYGRAKEAGQFLMSQQPALRHS